MEDTTEFDRTPDSSAADEQTQLRKRLFELDSAMDLLRREPGSASQLGILAEERDAIRVRLQAFDPPDAELGYQRNDEPFSKVEHDGRFIPSPSDPSSGGGFG